MHIENESDYLSDADLQGRVNALRGGPITLERAADCGLLALAVPVRYGGLPISHERRAAFHDRLYRLPDLFPVRAQLLAHLAVCRYVLDFGTPAQYDSFLPQLAAGKRVGLLTKTPVSAERVNAETYRLSGRTTPLTNLPAAALVLVRATVRGEIGTGGETPLFLLPHELVRPDLMAAHDSYHLLFAGKRVGRELRLGDTGTASGTAAWEATRWNRDRFAS